MYKNEECYYLIEDIKNLFYEVYRRIKSNIRQEKISRGQIEKIVLLFVLFPYIFFPILLFVIFKAISDGSSR